MRVDLHERLIASDSAIQAAALVESCVHCGLCASVCPTYEMLENELDSPRGRIYLIRDTLQGGTATAGTRGHLDNCLHCKACETACPSGVQYGHLIDLGQQLINAQQPRPFWQRAERMAIRSVMTCRPALGTLARIGWALKPCLPGRLRALVPDRPALATGLAPRHARHVLSLQGCVQPVFTPGHDAALSLLLDRFGVALVHASGGGCCGALSQHLDAPQAAKAAMRRNIDAWWPAIERGAEAILSSSTGCGAQLKDYGHLLRDDPAYAPKAARVSALVQDPGTFLNALWAERPLALKPLAAGEERLAFHVPCSLRNSLRAKAQVETILRRAGYTLIPVQEEHMCCGSAGAYSLLQPDRSEELLTRKLGHLAAGQPSRVVSANVGCILHLQKASPVEVGHWLELLAQRLPDEECSHA
ncbi:glycolate oxidase subunit GlcF [Pseudomonas sp. SAR267]|uniref:glycolate oxidase subunit GlcF n=1 Tax=unclassified Pseudomonas TaxID=196821 RepID=UPI0028A91A19|nr:glycolate oxidase subunit GlcF [Pseudomonas sp.]